MRVCVIGGGLAGCLLAWRLAGTRQVGQLDLLVAAAPGADATEVSGGSVRAFEADPAVSRLATDSMVELLGSRLLREWSGYVETGSVYLRDGAGVPAEQLADIERALPGSVQVLAGERLSKRGWRGVPAGSTAVIERRAGYLSPAGLRRAVLRELLAWPGVDVHQAAVQAVQPRPGGGLACRLAGGAVRTYDLVVLATGRWTPRLLTGSGLPADQFHTKSIQYGVYLADGTLPPAFVDETTGLYGRPMPAGRLLLGLPVEEWGVDPDLPPTTPASQLRAAELAVERFADLRLGPAVGRVAAADCYATERTLQLRPVALPGGQLFTFTGGSGGSAKTALAASRRAAIQLVGVPRETAAAAYPTAAYLTAAHPNTGNPNTGRTVTMHAHSAMASDVPYYHAVGVGAGPANLSLAALYASSVPEEQIALFDKQPGPAWHPSLLHPGVRMQTSWIKDLVSLVDPQHKLTFLNYLVRTGRLFALLNSQFDVIPRREYMRYLAWAAGQLDNINYGVTVDRVSFGAGGFTVYSGSRPLARSEHLVLGVGSRSVVPPGLAELPADRSFIADELGWRIDEMRADRDATVAVVGGGQTGLECVLMLLNHGFTDIQWFGRRQWFQTIDDSPAANDIYRPAHQQYLQTLSRPTRRRLIEEQAPTGDALTPGALRVLYQANYDGMLALGRFPVTLLPGRDVTHADADGDQIALQCTTPEKCETYHARYVVVAVGREHTPLPFDEDLTGRMEVDEDGELVVEPDYSVRWKGMNGHRIYALNRGRLSHGIPDANLTLLPVRSAVVLNSMFGREIYPIIDELCPIQWSQ